MGIVSSRNIDNETLLLLGKIKRISKAMLAVNVDVERVANDLHHANEFLNALAMTENDELFLLSLKLMRKLNLVAAGPEFII